METRNTHFAKKQFSWGRLRNFLYWVMFLMNSFFFIYSCKTRISYWRHQVNPLFWGNKDPYLSSFHSNPPNHPITFFFSLITVYLMRIIFPRDSLKVISCQHQQKKKKIIIKSVVGSMYSPFWSDVVMIVYLVCGEIRLLTGKKKRARGVLWCKISRLEIILTHLREYY